MGLFDRLFRNTAAKEPQPDIKFGRYSDSYKEVANYKAWDQALDKFEEKEYLDAYREFFRYLRDEQEDNVRYWEEAGGIRFELYQGSKKITGFASPYQVKAEAKIARAEALNVGFMRRLMEKNFNLKYSRFALDAEKNLTIIFDTYTLDGSPYKLYYALKEVATNADKQDDLLIDEFRMLQPIDNFHLEEIPQAEKEVKYRYIVGQVKNTVEEFDNGKLDKNEYPGGAAYLLLNLIYKLDFLIKPEGYMMETLEKIHRLYFAKDGKNIAQKNQSLVKELRRLADRPQEEFFKEMYRVTSTFGITTPVNHDRIVSFIDGELPNMDWYLENDHQPVAMAITGYIVGYCLFNYAAPKPDRDLFDLYFKVTESEYFRNLGFTADFYDREHDKLNRKAIKRAIDDIVSSNSDQYTELNPAISTLDFRSLPGFAKSYLLMIRNLNMVKKD